MRGPAGSAPVAPDVAARLATGARRAWGACVTAARLLVGVPAAAAQITGTVDIGVSTVRYDGFLPSGAAAVTPALRWDRPAGTLTASGTYLRFESGHRSLQGLLAGSLFTPPTPRPWRGELAVSAGASRYVDFASFWQDVLWRRAPPRGRRRHRNLGPPARADAEADGKPFPGRRHDLHRPRILRPCRARFGRARGDARHASLEPGRRPRRVRRSERRRLGPGTHGARPVGRPLCH